MKDKITLICAILSGMSNCFASEISATEVFSLIKDRDRVVKS